MMTIKGNMQIIESRLSKDPWEIQEVFTWERIHLACRLLVPVSMLFLLVSCLSLDPAEKLARQIEVKANELEKSKNTTVAFDFIPDENRLKEAPRYVGEVFISVVPESANTKRSDIFVNDWFHTTYHNRFIQVSEKLEAKKNPGVPFKIVLEKSDGGIFWKILH